MPGKAKRTARREASRKMTRAGKSLGRTLHKFREADARGDTPAASRAWGQIDRADNRYQAARKEYHATGGRRAKKSVARGERRAAARSNHRFPPNTTSWLGPQWGF